MLSLTRARWSRRITSKSTWYCLRSRAVRPAAAGFWYARQFPRNTKIASRRPSTIVAKSTGNARESWGIVGLNNPPFTATGQFSGIFSKPHIFAALNLAAVTQF